MQDFVQVWSWSNFIFTKEIRHTKTKNKEQFEHKTASTAKRPKCKYNIVAYTWQIGSHYYCNKSIELLRYIQWCGHKCVHSPQDFPVCCCQIVCMYNKCTTNFSELKVCNLFDLIWHIPIKLFCFSVRYTVMMYLVFVFPASSLFFLNIGNTQFFFFFITKPIFYNKFPLYKQVCKVWHCKAVCYRIILRTLSLISACVDQIHSEYYEMKPVTLSALTEATANSFSLTTSSFESSATDSLASMSLSRPVFIRLASSAMWACFSSYTFM